MSITKTLIGLEENHIKTLEKLVKKNDKRFRNKSAVIRTLLECLEGEQKDGQVTGLIVVKAKNCSAFDLSKKGVVEDLLKDSKQITIESTKDNSYVGKPSLEVVINSRGSHRL